MTFIINDISHELQYRLPPQDVNTLMNSVNYRPIAAGETARTVDQPYAGSPSLAALLPQATKPGATGKQRVGVLVAAAAVQTLVLFGLIQGLNHKPAPLPRQTMMVGLLPEKEAENEPPPPPKPLLATPQITMDVPVIQIYEPPPPTAAPPSDRALTTSPTPVTVNPKFAIETYQTKLLRHLNNNKRYPARARAKRETGVVFVRFTMDRRGHVTATSLEKPCKFVTLNDEGLALLARAQPLPAPPPELEGAEIEMIVPVEFSLR